MCHFEAAVKPKVFPSAVHSGLLALRAMIPRVRSKWKANSREPAHNQRMKRILLVTAIAALLVAGGWWLARDARPAPANQPTRDDVGINPPEVQPKPGQKLLPPDQARRFTDFTPEQRVEFARRGHGPGG